MKVTRYAVCCTLALVFATFLGLMPLRAQQDSPKDEQPKPAAKSTTWAPDASTADGADVEAPPMSPPNPYGGAIKDATTGLPLFGTSKTPLRWGSFSISTFQSMGIHDEFEPAGGSTPISSDLAILLTGLMFDHGLFRNKSRIVLQYVPQMAITDGEVHANASANNNLSLGTKFELTPRLSVTLEDGFVQVHDNPLVPQNYLASDTKTGSVVQNNFLQTNGSFLANTTSAVFEYALSARTNITASPLYRYARAMGGTAYLADGQTYAGAFTLGHAFSPRRTAGITESYQYLKQATGGTHSTATFNTTGIFYSEQLARTLQVTANVGAAKQSYSEFPGAGVWTVTGGLSVISSFSTRVATTLAYSRGTAFNNNYVTRRRADRADGSIGFILTPRISWTNGFGYYRELGGGPSTDGKYATTSFSWRIHGNFSFFTFFGYTFQSSETPQLLSGERRTLAYGISWTPSQFLPK